MADKLSIQILTLSGTAPGAVTAHRLVGFDDAQATVAGQKVKGVARSAAATGDVFPVGVKGTDVVETGGVFVAGDELVSDASGRAVIASGSAAAVITGITAANPGVVTAVAHKFQTGDVVVLTDVVGMVEVNQNAYDITVVSVDTFNIGVNTSAFTAYTSGGAAHRVGPRQHVIGNALEASTGSGKFAEVLLK